MAHEAHQMKSKRVYEQGEINHRISSHPHPHTHTHKAQSTHVNPNLLHHKKNNERPTTKVAQMKRFPQA